MITQKFPKILELTLFNSHFVTIWFTPWMDFTKRFTKIILGQTKVYALFNFDLEANLIALDMVNKLELVVHDHVIPYPLGWLNKDTKIKVTKQHKIKFSISVEFIDEVELDIVLLDVCGIMFGIPYMYMRDATFMRREINTA